MDIQPLRPLRGGPASALPSPPDAAAEVARLARGRGALLDVDEAFPEAELIALAETGLLRAPLPLALGGADLGRGGEGAAALAEVLTRIGAGSLPLGRLYEGHVNALGLILAYGNPAQQARAAEDTRAGRLFGVWNTDDRADPLRIEEGTEGPVLRGRKVLASGAGWVERPLVTTATPEGPQMLVPALARGERADLSGWRAQGMRASATGAVALDGLPAGPAERIGAPGDYHREPLFSGGAWRFLAVQTGGAAELFDLLCRHLRELGRDGDPHQRARVGEAAVALETARLWVGQAARRLADGEMEPEATVAYVNLARRAVEQAALDILALAQRSVGLAAFIRPHPLERVARDLATYLRQPAPDRALDLAAAHLLGREGWPW
ncbi:acyl-CoA dehydrogenase family protein [Teichococcus coralli]|uniref:acyl-CoA dehydrogenase family protein n=1 Tax=Teichococcus coralli TaxID=2545983 RepID=UPI001927070D